MQHAQRVHERSESAKRKEADRCAGKLASRRRGAHPRWLRLLSDPGNSHTRNKRNEEKYGLVLAAAPGAWRRCFGAGVRTARDERRLDERDRRAATGRAGDAE